MTKVPERPIADPKVVDALRDMADALARAFRAAGCQSVDSPILQPADEIIDLLKNRRIDRLASRSTKGAGKGVSHIAERVDDL
ncbi:MAG: hypothetical protein AAGF19_07250, partial [Pseudomonadota bacterium]